MKIVLLQQAGWVKEHQKDYQGFVSIGEVVRFVISH
jgi:hypothetical protein